MPTQVLPLLILAGPLGAALIAAFSGERIRPGAYRVATLAHILALGAALAVLSIVAGPGHPTIRISLLSSPWPFFSLGLSIDRLAGVMSVLIAGIGTVLHLYSIRFMQQERGVARFHALLSLSISVLLFMVSSASLVMLFLFWQLLSGLLSLLAYNYAHPPTAQGSFRTFVMLRAGDVFFLSGLVLAYHLYGTMDFQELFARASAGSETFYPLGTGFPLTIRGRTLVTLLIFVGAMSKSAQFPLHMWLPDSLYAPTPVHALLHAGIINAGGFLLNRLSPLYGQSPATLHVVFSVGLLTALLGASMMLTQNDIKKTLGYSTIGQMGYMIMECGLGAFALAVFHLIAHGLFKATIFLNCGNVIHAARQDPRIPKREMGEGPPDFSLLTWITGFVTTLILPLVILLSVHGVLSIPPADSPGALIFLFFSWITSAQAILTLYRLRALGSWKAAGIMVLTLALVMATYLVAVERFTLFLYPEPGVASGFFRSAALPEGLFNTLIAAGALCILLYWISVLARSHGRPSWISDPVRDPLKERAGRISARIYLLFMNRLYLDALVQRSGHCLRRALLDLDQSPFFLPLAAVSALALAIPSLLRGPYPSPETIGLLLLSALALPLFPFHSLYRMALTRLPVRWGPLSVLLALGLPAAGLPVAAVILAHLPSGWRSGLRVLALAGALYGSLRALAQTRVTPLLVYTSLVFYSILWWFLCLGGRVTFAATLFAGAAAWVTGGLLLAWNRVRWRYGDLPMVQIGGLAGPMPRLATLTALLVMAGAGLPPFGLFTGYLGLLLGPSTPPAPGDSALSGAPIAGLALVLLAWFMASWILYRLMQRLFFGPHRTDIPYEDLTPAEMAPLILVLLFLAGLSLLPYGPFPPETPLSMLRSTGEIP
jgi:NADH-quinone oxidoreductase subunit L